MLLQELKRRAASREDRIVLRSVRGLRRFLNNAITIWNNNISLTNLFTEEESRNSRGARSYAGSTRTNATKRTKGEEKKIRMQLGCC
jgi:hypothetical protein